jgi:multiple sugar transport system permease protein
MGGLHKKMNTKSPHLLKNRKITTWFYGYLFIAPTMLGVFILNLWPIIQSIYYSFNEVKGFNSPKFVGFDNYARLIHDTEVYRSLLNTFLYCILTVPLGIIVSLVVAVFLNTKIKGKGIFRCLYYLPVVSAPAAVALVWRWLYNQQYGLINQLLGIFGIPGPDWLGSRELAVIAVAIVGIWSMVGYNMIILIAGLQNIPRSLYEASEIDGAGAFAKFFRITIPLLSPTLFFVTVITVISSFQVFDHIFMMLKPESPSFKYTESIVYLFYRYTFQNYNKGYGSAIVVLILVIILILTLIQLKLQKKWVHYNN